MKPFLFALLFSSLVTTLYAQSTPEPLLFKGRIGFTDSGEKIVAQKFLDNDRKLLLVGRKSIQLWDVEHTTLLKTRPHQIPNLDKSDTTVEISPDGTKAIALDSLSWRLIGKEKKVWATAWDLESVKKTAVLERSTESVRDAEWSKNGATLLTSNGRYNVKRTEVCFWDGNSLTLGNCLLLKGELLWHHLSADGKWFGYARRSTIASTTVQETLIAMVETKPARVNQNLNFGVGYVGISGLPSPLDPSERSFAANKDGKILVWEIDGTSWPKYEIEPAKKGGQAVFCGFSKDGRFLFASQERTLKMYETVSGKLVKSLPGVMRSRNWTIYSMDLRSVDDTLLIGYCGKLDAFSLRETRKLYEIDLVCKERFSRLGSTLEDSDVLRFHPRNDFLLTFSDKTVRIWSTKTGGILHTLIDPERAVNKMKDNKKDDGLARSAGWIMNGEYLDAASADERSIFLWGFTCR